MTAASSPGTPAGAGPARPLEGRAVVVTGASRGLGARIAQTLAGAGATVYLTGRGRDDSLQQVASSITANGGRARAVRCDSGVEDDVARLVAAVVTEHGQVDLLVNNAALRLSTTVLDTPTEDFERILRANVVGPFLLWRHVIPTMLSGHGGNVINLISTNAPRQPFIGMAPYRMTKVALTYLSVDLASELADTDVAVNAFDPGPVVSGGTAAVRQDREQRYGPVAHHAQDPVSVLDEPILWLAAQRARDFTGQVVRRVDFGRTWGPDVPPTHPTTPQTSDRERRSSE